MSASEGVGQDQPALQAASGAQVYGCKVLKVAAGSDGTRQVALTGGPFTDPGGTFYGLPDGTAGDNMFAVALVAVATQKVCAAFVDIPSAYHNLSALHISGSY